MNKPTNKQSYKTLLLRHNKKERLKLFSEAKKPSLEIPMLKIDGVLMTPLESLNYLKIRVEAYQKAKNAQKEVVMVCPTCGSVPHL